MPRLISTFLSFTVLTACTASKPVPHKTDVFEWSRKTVERVMSQPHNVNPQFFELAKVPEDYDYSTSNATFQGPLDNTNIDEANASFLRDVGVVSALADYCMLPWNEKNFLPMMQWQRSQLPPEKRMGQLISKIGFSHGYAMGVTDQLLEHWQPDCVQLEQDLKGKYFLDTFPVCKRDFCGG